MVLYRIWNSDFLYNVNKNLLGDQTKPAGLVYSVNTRVNIFWNHTWQENHVKCSAYLEIFGYLEIFLAYKLYNITWINKETWGSVFHCNCYLCIVIVQPEKCFVNAFKVYMRKVLKAKRGTLTREPQTTYPEHQITFLSSKSRHVYTFLSTYLFLGIYFLITFVKSTL